MCGCGCGCVGTLDVLHIGWFMYPLSSFPPSLSNSPSSPPSLFSPLLPSSSLHSFLPPPPLLPPSPSSPSSLFSPLLPQCPQLDITILVLFFTYFMIPLTLRVTTILGTVLSIIQLIISTAVARDTSPELLGRQVSRVSSRPYELPRLHS